MNSKQSGRRRFLKGGLAIAGLAAAGVRPPASRGQTVGKEIPGVARDIAPYGERSRFVTSVRQRLEAGDPYGGVLRDAAVVTPLQDSEGIITPNSLHFIAAREPSPYTSPTDINPQQHQLLIHGLVDRPRIYTMEELKRFPSVSRIHFIECVGNTSPGQGRWKNETVQERHGKTSCAQWTGVLLSVLLREGGVQKGAKWIIAEGSDKVKHAMELPLEKAMDDVMLAYGQNGEPVRPENGFPLRLLAPGYEGVRNVKWLRRIYVVDEPYLTQAESNMNPRLRPDGKSLWFNLEMGPKSVITFPAAGGPRLPGRGYYQITGLAWSGGGAVRKVEVSTDGGRSWKEAQLQDPVLRIAHTRFYLDWNWNGEETTIQSRCTDERGNIQPSLKQFSEIWGVQPEYFQTTTNPVSHFNPIQPWRVSRDGSVQNAFWL